MTSLGPELSIILHYRGPFEAVLNHLTTNWGLTLVFFTSLIGTLAHHELFWPIFIIFGVKCPFFHDSKPLQMVYSGAKLCSTLVPKRLILMVPDD